MKAVKHYRAKTLFDGSVIDKIGKYVAVPEKGFKGFQILVEFKKEKMLIKNWLKAEGFKRFPDRWGRGIYTLWYFRWEGK